MQLDGAVAAVLHACGGQQLPEMHRRSARRPGQTLVIGLTGSIGMGKSTVSQWFQELGVAINDADAAVHELYSPGGAAVAPVRDTFGPSVIGQDGGVDRSKLSPLVVGSDNKDRLQRLEAIVHPLVAQHRSGFVAAARTRGEALCVLDIPLLFELSLESGCDLVLVVSAPAAVQRERVLARPGMTPQKFEAILSKQMHDEKKRSMANLVIDTGKPLEETRAFVWNFVAQCRSGVAKERCIVSRRLVGRYSLAAVALIPVLALILRIQGVRNVLRPRL